MDIDTFTQRSQQAILAARDLAASSHHPSVMPEHILAGLLSQTDGIIYSIITTVGSHVSQIQTPLDAALAALPQIHGASELGFTQESLAVLDSADAERAGMKDSYTSVEHLMIAIAESRTPSGDLLRSVGIDKDSILSVLARVRGSQRVTSQNPEETFAPLTQWRRTD